jgi:hypothetical protein
MQPEITTQWEINTPGMDIVASRMLKTYERSHGTQVGGERSSQLSRMNGRMRAAYMGHRSVRR